MKHSLLMLLTFWGCTTLSAWAEKQIFVSPKGNDRAAGTFTHPLRSIQAALEKAGTLENEDVQIILRKGIYEQSQTLEIGSSGKYASLTICPYQNEKVSISGGKEIPLSAMKKVSDKKIIARLPESARKQIREIDFNRLNIPMTDLRPSGFGRPSSPAWSELFANDAPLSLSRWPNDSTVLIGKVLEAGTGEKVKEAKLPVFQYNEDRPSAWTQAGSFWIGGYFAHGYASDMIRVDHLDPETKTIHTAQQTVYGFMTGADWRRWYALNLLEELDLPGEYVIDKENGKMYVYLPENTRTLNVSVMNDPLVAIENCRNITLSKLTFEYGRSIGIYLENTQHVRITGCTVRNVGGVGISIGKGTETPDKKTLKPHAAEAGGTPKSRVVGDLMGRLYQDILFNRNGGNLGETGSVAFMFDRKGYIAIAREDLDVDEDSMLEDALNAGADDFVDEDDEYKVITTPDNFQSVVEGLEKAGFKHKTAELNKIPQNTLEITDEKTARMILLLMDKLEEHDDVQNVYSNFDIPDEVMDKVQL